VVEIIHAHPDERDAILEWLHRHRGNAFVNQVTSRLGQVERGLPQGVELQHLRASVTIPGGKRLAGNWKADVGTTAPTRATIDISPAGVRLWMSPAIFVDASWPLQNAEIRGGGINFADGKSYAEVSDGHGWGSGMWSIKDGIAEMIRGLLDGAVRGTPFAQPGYQLSRDTDLSGTLERIVSSIQNLTTDRDHSTTHKPAQRGGVTERDLDRVSLGATVAVRGGGRFLTDGTGMVIAPGSTISVDVEGAGNVGDITATRSAADAAQAAHVSAVRVSAGDLQVVSDGKPVAKLETLTIRPGGHVTIDQMTLLGKAAKARDTESGLAFLAALIALGARDARAADGAYRYAQDPKIVDGATRRAIEDKLTQSVQKMILDNRAAVPGVDLAKILGL